MTDSTSAARKDVPHVTPNWDVKAELIDGVLTRDVRNIVTRNGITTELHRRDWGIVSGEVEHAIHVALRPGALSAWHMHRCKTDHFFVVAGMLKVVLYDNRAGSPTNGSVNEFVLSPMRPTLVAIPPEVWHGVQNVAGETSCFVNYFNDAYDYDDPDEWRLPADTAEIPYRF